MTPYVYMSEDDFEYILESPFIEVSNWSVHNACDGVCHDCGSHNALEYCYACGSSDVGIICENCGSEYSGIYNDDYCKFWQCTVDPTDVFEYDYESIEEYRYDLHIELMEYYDELMEHRRVALTTVLLSCTLLDEYSSKLIADYAM